MVYSPFTEFPIGQAQFLKFDREALKLSEEELEKLRKDCAGPVRLNLSDLTDLIDSPTEEEQKRAEERLARALASRKRALEVLSKVNQ
jgi:hypothetical protein